MKYLAGLSLVTSLILSGPLGAQPDINVGGGVKVAVGQNIAEIEQLLFTEVSDAGLLESIAVGTVTTIKAPRNNGNLRRVWPRRNSPPTEVNYFVVCAAFQVSGLIGIKDCIGGVFINEEGTLDLNDVQNVDAAVIAIENGDEVVRLDAVEDVSAKVASVSAIVVPGAPATVHAWYEVSGGQGILDTNLQVGPNGSLVDIAFAVSGIGQTGDVQFFSGIASAFAVRP